LKKKKIAELCHWQRLMRGDGNQKPTGRQQVSQDPENDLKTRNGNPEAPNPTVLNPKQVELSEYLSLNPDPADPAPAPAPSSPARSAGDDDEESTDEDTPLAQRASRQHRCLAARSPPLPLASSPAPYTLHPQPRLSTRRP